MIRLSVTDLDNYRYWRDSEDQELDQLLMRLRGQEPPGPNMLASRAFHRMLERTDANDPDLDCVTVDGWTFTFALDGEIALPMLRELKGEQLFDTPSGPVTLVGKVDGLHGRTVNDWKLTERFDAERYADSFQWRSYLLMFKANRFVYDAFQCRYADDQRVYIYEHHRVVFNAYPAMADDVHREVCALAAIVAEYVPEKIQAEAA